MIGKIGGGRRSCLIVNLSPLPPCHSWTSRWKSKDDVQEKWSRCINKRDAWHGWHHYHTTDEGIRYRGYFRNKGDTWWYVVSTSVDSWPICCYQLPAHPCVIWGHFPTREEMIVVLKKIAAAERDRRASAQLGDAWFAKKYPTLYEYMTATQYDDGQARDTARLSIWFEPAEGLKAALNDVDNARSTYCTSSGFQSLLEALETKLASDTAEWRVNKWQTPAKGKKTGK